MLLQFREVMQRTQISLRVRQVREEPRDEERDRSTLTGLELELDFKCLSRRFAISEDSQAHASEICGLIDWTSLFPWSVAERDCVKRDMPPTARV